MRVLILGSAGQLGADLVRTNPGHTVLTHTRFDADITDVPGLARFVKESRPEAVFNTVAFNRTEACEGEPGLALAVNALAPRALAEVCAEIHAPLLQFSTDFVFDGKKGAPYVESDPPSPLNVYGYSKFGGERFVLAASPRNTVVRTASLFGAAGSRAKGGNFVTTILRLAKAGEPLRVVDDIRMSPTYTRDLAEKVWEILDLKILGGTFHLANEGGTSWYDFARSVLERAGATADLKPVPSAPGQGKMRRPTDTRLASERIPGLGLKSLRPWTEALEAYLKEASPSPAA